MQAGDRALSLHEFGLLETLMAARHLGCAPREVVIFGVQPKEVHPGLGLSTEVAEAVPKVIELVLAEARS
jgi:hydrogenase maturation protease